MIRDKWLQFDLLDFHKKQQWKIGKGTNTNDCSETDLFYCRMNTVEVFAIKEDQCHRKTLVNSKFACHKNLTRNVFLGCDYASGILLLSN